MRVLRDAICGVALIGGHFPCLGQQIEVPAHISGGVMTSMLVTKVMPVFPREAMHAEVNGAVVMRVVIGIDGHIQTASVVSGPEMLRAAYLTAVRQWVYMPFMLNGKKVRVDTTVTLILNMGSDAPFQPIPEGAFGNGYGPKSTEDQPKPTRVRVSSGVMMGQLRKKVDPVYPPIAREEHVSGAVVLHVVIGGYGKVLQVSVISGPGVLRASAVAAVRQWEYKPYLLEGIPVEVDTVVTIHTDFGG